MAKNKSKPAVEPEVETELEDGAEGNETEGAAGNGDATKKKTYETMIVGVSKARKPLREALDALALELGCKNSDLVWYSIEQTLKAPPKVAPQGSAGTNVGTASGFWVVPLVDSKGKANGIKVVEVETRGQVSNGRTFLRYRKGDAKERARAKAQATRAAQSDAAMIGYKGEISIEELETATA